MKSVLIIISVLAFGLCAQAQAPVLISSKKRLIKVGTLLLRIEGIEPKVKFSVREKRSCHHSTVHFYAHNTILVRMNRIRSTFWLIVFITMAELLDIYEFSKIILIMVLTCRYILMLTTSLVATLR